MSTQLRRGGGKRLSEEHPHPRKDLSPQSFSPIDHPAQVSPAYSNPSSSDAYSVAGPRSGRLNFRFQPQSLDINTQGTLGRQVAIPALQTPHAAESSKSSKKRRTAHACDSCQKAKAGCNGGQPCLRCKMTRSTCFYRERKRDRDKKEISTLKREINQVSRHNQNVRDALQQVRNDSSLSLDEVKLAIDGILQIIMTASPPEDQMNSPTSSARQPSDPVDTDEGGEYEADAEVGSTGSLAIVGLDTDRNNTRALELKQKYCEHILSSLSSGHHAEFNLQALRNGDKRENIYKSLRTEQAADNFIRFDDQRDEGCKPTSVEGNNSLVQSHGSTSVETEGKESGMGLDSFGDEGDPDKEDPSTTRSWTTVTPDVKLLEHFILLYFCWEYPIFCSLSKQPFLQDFKSGRHRYCSPLLVNILSGLGCRYSERTSVGESTITGHALGGQFLAEAERLWELEQSNPTLTTIQATCLMSIWEASRGRDKLGLFYSKRAAAMAIEMGIHMLTDESDLSEIEKEVRSATFWGAFNSNQIWSLCLGRCPQMSGARFRLKPPVFDRDEAPWVPFSDDGLLIKDEAIQSSNSPSILHSLCDLSVVTCRSLNLIYASKRPLTSRMLIDVYTEYLEWHASMPHILRGGENSTPAVLFLHLYYQFTVLLLFRPFTNLILVGSSVIPKDVCMQATDAIRSLITSYRQLHGLRQTPSFIPYISLASSIVRISAAIDEMSVTSRAAEGISDLREMSATHVLATIGADILQYSSTLSRGYSYSGSAPPELSLKLSTSFLSEGMRESTLWYYFTQEFIRGAFFVIGESALAQCKEELTLSGFEVAVPEVQ